MVFHAVRVRNTLCSTSENQTLDFVLEERRAFLELSFYGSYGDSTQMKRTWRLGEAQMREEYAGWWKAEYETWPPP